MTAASAPSVSTTLAAVHFRPWNTHFPRRRREFAQTVECRQRHPQMIAWLDENCGAKADARLVKLLIGARQFNALPRTYPCALRLPLRGSR
jgi:hypothetical protein